MQQLLLQKATYNHAVMKKHNAGWRNFRALFFASSGGVFPHLLQAYRQHFFRNKHSQSSLGFQPSMPCCGGPRLLKTNAHERGAGRRKWGSDSRVKKTSQGAVLLSTNNPKNNTGHIRSGGGGGGGGGGSGGHSTIKEMG